MKKCAAVIICVLMIMCSLPLPVMSVLFPAAFAAENVGGGTFGNNFSWALDSDGVLTVTGVGRMNFGTVSIAGDDSVADVPWLDPNRGSVDAFGNRIGDTSIRKVILSDRITSIGDEAFACCYALTEAVIPDSVKKIGAFAFCNCTALENVKLPASLETVSEYLFAGCTALKESTIPDGVDEIGAGAFSGCIALRTVNIPATVGYIGDGAFADCRSLLSISIPDGVSSIGEYTFHRCGSLTTASLPDSVVSIGRYAFAECKKLDTQSFPASLVSVGSYAFAECTALSSVSLPDSVVAVGDYAFSECAGLKNIKLSSGLSNIGGFAFFCCTSLEEIEFPENVALIGRGAFAGCEKLGKMTVSENNSKFYGQDNCVIERNTQSLVVGCKNSVIPEGITEIGEGAFYNCTGLDSLSLPSSVTAIRSFAFFCCTGIPEISVPENVSVIENSAFAGCTGVKTITVSESNPVYAGIGNCVIDKNDLSVAVGCKTSVIPDGMKKIGAYAFDRCLEMTEIVIPASVSSVDDFAFYGCPLLKNVYFKGSEEEWKAITVGVGNNALTDAALHCGALSLDGAAVTFRESEIFYTGENIRPAVTVTAADGTVLTENADYIIGYPENSSVPGEYTVTICGIGSCIGTASAKYTIKKCPIDTLRAELSGTSFICDGTAHRPSVTLTAADGIVLLENTDYIVAYPEDCAAVGEYSVTVTGIGCYSGTAILLYKVEAPAVIPGDVDGDGDVTSADARLALRRSVGLEDYAEGSRPFIAADIDKSGNVEASDARLILRGSVGLEDRTKW